MSELELQELAHEVHSRGSSLQQAVDALRGLPPEERAELLRLMAEQARRLAESVTDFEQRHAKENPAK